MYIYHKQLGALLSLAASFVPFTIQTLSASPLHVHTDDHYARCRIEDSWSSVKVFASTGGLVQRMADVHAPEIYSSYSKSSVCVKIAFLRSSAAFSSTPLGP